MSQLIPLHSPLHRENVSLRKRRKKGRWLLLVCLSTFLIFMAFLHWTATTHTAYPTLSTATCADTIRNTDYTKIIPRLTANQQVEAVQLISDVTGGQPSALVQVVSKNAEDLLDVYVYGCTVRMQSPIITPLLKLQGLIQGNVEVTRAHTLSIGQLDSSLGIDGASLLLPMQENIYHEYRWSNARLQQINFPSLYPILSRSEAEALQNIANNDQTLPWNNPITTAEQMAHDIFHRSTDLIKATLIHKDQANANVLLELKQPQAEVMVTLSRLIEQDSKGLWFVTFAQSPNISLDQSTLNNPISSPLTIHGTFKQHIEKANMTIFDHTLTPLQLLSDPTQPHIPAMASVTINATNNTFAGTTYFTNSRADQPGLLLIEALPPENSNDQEQILLINLLLG